MILFPYGLIVAYWFILKGKGRLADWYDEKQWRDVTRAGFTTLLLMIPVMFFFFLAVSLRNEHYSQQITWFPMFLFSALLFFSLFTLVSYRRA
jgi:quinol-cytochrome oxidoreductase complex cytochrome b subunit